MEQNCTQLVRAIARAHEWLAMAPLFSMRSKGFPEVTATMVAAMLRIGDGVMMEDLRKGWGGPIVSDERGGGSISRQAVNQLIASLEANGYVNLETSPTDRRRKMIYPTDSGLVLQQIGRDCDAYIEYEVLRVVGDKIDMVTQMLEDLTLSMGSYKRLTNDVP